MTHSSFLIDLLRKGRKAAASGAGGLRLHRRQVLQGVGVAGVAAASWLAEDVLHIRRMGRALVVALRSNGWVIDPDLFGAEARIGHRAGEDQHWLRLSQALLPGTDLRMDFIAAITRDIAGWTVNIHMPALGFRARLPLLEWLGQSQALTAAIPPRALRFGGHAIAMAGPARMSLLHDFRAEFSGTTFSLQGGTIAAVGESIAIAPTSELGLLKQAGMPGDTLAHLEMLAPRLRGGALALGALDHGTPVAFVSDSLERLTGEAGLRAGRTVDAFLVQGGGAVRFGGRRNGSLQLDRAAILTTASTAERLSSVAAHLSARPFAIALTKAQAEISGHNRHPLKMEFRNGKTGNIAAKVRLNDLWMPLSDGDSAVAAFHGRLIDLKIPQSCDDACVPLLRFREPLRPEDDIISWSMKDEVPDFVLLRNDKNSCIFLSRGYDLFYLGFQFGNNTKLAINTRGDGEPIILNPRREPLSMTVLFEPQHLSESWYDPKPPGEAIPGTEPGTDTARIHLSARSRLVFDMKSNRAEIKVSIDDLTQWGKYQLQVSPRARVANPMPLDQMLPGWNKKTLNETMVSIAGTIRPPSDAETSLEMAGRLQFSPAQTGQWLLPRNGPVTVEPKPQLVGPLVDQTTAELWHARLDDEGRKGVRAIWAPTVMEAGKFNYKNYKPLPKTLEQQAGKPPPLEEEKCPIPNPTDGHPLNDWPVRDDLLWEIVAQTSIAGIPALRARAPEETRLDNSVRNILQNMPRSRVVRLDDKATLWKEMDAGLDGAAVAAWNHAHPLEKPKGPSNPIPPEAGIALTSPFEDADIILTSMGGALKAEWRGEPPLLSQPLNADCYLKDGPKDHGHWPSGFGLEEFTYQTQFGRDIFVKTVEKGYLLPLGCRASYVELTERRLVHSANHGGIVAVPIKRRFILVREPEKFYPGLYQPHDGREFPPGRISMITRVTPDLHFETDDAIRTGFWPRALNDCKPIDFQFSVDDNAGPLTCNMLFVPNKNLADPNWAAAMAKKYNISDEDRRTVRAGGVQCRYAPSETAGDTSFSTDRWLLTVSGREGASTDPFAMDSFMEGASQPPFYPRMQWALISVQSIDRLMGRQHGPIRVRYNNDYVTKGFTGGNIFLDVVVQDGDQEVVMDTLSQGASTGGLGKTKMYLAALSRSQGPIGAKDRATSPPAIAEMAGAETTSPAKIQPAQYKFADAAGGKFTPADFFSGTKLLGFDMMQMIGLDGISDELAQAPKVIEKLQYGVTEELRLKAEGLIHDLNRLVNGGKRTVDGKVVTARGMVAEVDIAIAKVFPAQNGQKTELKTLYPRLAQSLNETAAAIAKLDVDISKRGGLGAALDDVMTTVTAAKALDREFDDVLRNPVPAIVPAEINALTGQLATVAGAIDAQRKEALALVTGARGVLQTLICTELAPIADLLGTEGCTTLFKGGVAAAGHALFAEFVLPHIQEAVKTINDLEKESSGILSEFTEDLAMPVRNLAQIAARLLNQAALLEQWARRGELGVQVWRQAYQDLSTFVRVFTNDLLLGSTEIDRQADVVNNAISAMDAPSKLKAQLRTALDRLRGAQGPLDKLKGARQALVNVLPKPVVLGELLPAPPSDDDLKKLLHAVQTVRNCRRDLLAAMGEWLAALQAFEKDVESAAAAAAKVAGKQPKPPSFATLEEPTRKLIRGITIIGAFEKGQEQKLREALKPLDSNIAALKTSAALLGADTGDYGNKLRDLYAALPDAAADLCGYPFVDGAQGLEAYRQNVNAYLDSQEDKLAALLLETALPLAADQIKHLRDVLLTFRTAGVTALTDINKLTVRLLDGLQNAADGSALSKTLALVTNKVWTADLQKSRNDAGKATLVLDHLAHTPTDADLRALHGWVDHPETFPASELIVALTGMLTAIAKGRLGDIFSSDALRKLVTGYRDQMVQLIPLILPTRAHLNYDWNTPVSEAFGVFLPGEDGKAKTTKLTLSTNVFIDLLSGERSVDVDGKLDAFCVRLIGADLELVTLQFQNGVSFKSRNGAKPTFDAKVTNVEIGEPLKFLQDLQSYLSPGGDGGFFLELSAAEIVAGYGFNLGLITIGELQFLNVMLIVSATLPFDDDEASFWFGVGDEAHPFLIACPPYGGGGFVGIKSTASRIIGLQAQFMFGGAAALQFGPLKAQGRLMAGIYMRRTEHAGDLISGFFEAVGEGSIACFSVCVFLRIAVFQSGSNMYGTATYGYEFHVGLAKITYRVTASYTVAGHSEKRSGDARELPPIVCEPPWMWTSVPKKHLHWQAYRSAGLDIDMLRE